MPMRVMKAGWVGVRGCNCNCNCKCRQGRRDQTRNNRMQKAATEATLNTLNQTTSTSASASIALEMRLQHASSVIRDNPHPSHGHYLQSCHIKRCRCRDLMMGHDRFLSTPKRRSATPYCPLRTPYSPSHLSPRPCATNTCIITSP